LVSRKPAVLSGGQRQRVALGRAIVREPAAFLFDEPLSSLDVALRGTLREEIKALHQRLHTTALYVTHDQSEAMALGERVCVLREGQIQQVGLPGEVYDRPANRFVAGFFGSPPMNFLQGRIRRVDGTNVVEFAGARVSLAAHEGDGGETTALVGVRPHDLSLESPSQPNGIVLTGRVSQLEPFGSRTDVHVVLASGEKCTISVPPHIPIRVDEEIRVCVNPKRLHLFKPDGVALGLRDA
jgi:ABC-type sugar transport system ATPase subunit